MINLQEKLHYTFKNPALLETALSHSSYANENKSVGESNERLEFLGDSVLGMTVAEFLFINYPELPEGRMTKLRAELVCETSLYAVAQEIDLGRCIHLGRGEERTGGRRRPSILADCVEAIIAAMYLDGGIEVAKGFIYEHILSDVGTEMQKHVSDYKTALQELIQKKGDRIIEYHIISESGPDHCKTFTAEVCVNNEQIGLGTGRTKKEAEQSAAGAALERMGK
jgi:ribonuclease-3